MAPSGTSPVTPDGADDGVAPLKGHSTRSRTRLLILAAVLVVLIVGGVTAALTVPGGSTDVLTGRTGAPAPRFALASLSQPNRTVSSSQLSEKDLVLNFWASWCFPCQQEMPVLQAAAQRLRGRVGFVGIDSNDSRSAALGFLSRVRVSYLTLFDPNGSLADAYGLFGLPTTVFVSSTGKVLGRHSGQLSAAGLQSALTQAFGPTAVPS